MKNDIIEVEEKDVQQVALSVNFTDHQLDQFRHQREQLYEVVKSELKKDVDYGIVPGTKKPSLLKPGAEKLCKLFGFGSRILESKREIDFEKKWVWFCYTVEIIHLRTGTVVAQCEGSANSQEKKYSYANPADILNTLQKMAQKRAYVGAAIIATGASEFFTQDIEDMDPSSFSNAPAELTEQQRLERESRELKKETPKPKGPICCGKAMMVSKFKDPAFGDITPWYCLTCKNKVERTA